MADAIEDLRHRYKFIVIDSPPIMAATDAVIVSALTDGVLARGPEPFDAEGSSHSHPGLLSSVKGRMLRSRFERSRFGSTGLLLFLSAIIPTPMATGDEEDDAKISPQPGTIS